MIVILLLLYYIFVLSFLSWVKYNTEYGSFVKLKVLIKLQVTIFYFLLIKIT